MWCIRHSFKSCYSFKQKTGKSHIDLMICWDDCSNENNFINLISQTHFIQIFPKFRKANPKLITWFFNLRYAIIVYIAWQKIYNIFIDMCFHIAIVFLEWIANLRAIFLVQIMKTYTTQINIVFKIILCLNRVIWLLRLSWKTRQCLFPTFPPPPRKKEEKNNVIWEIFPINFLVIILLLINRVFTGEVYLYLQMTLKVRYINLLYQLYISNLMLRCSCYF